MLAKLLGVYSIQYKNNNISLKQHVIVMENLFYNRVMHSVFDLKGSLRNRFVTPADGSPEKTVLLDENLLADLHKKPLCIPIKSKLDIIHAIRNDTLFLSSVNVMDYSLLVGIDDKTQELVIGIIDYMRKYTWDKLMETWVKSTGLMGGKGKDPTIISPKQYKLRFRDAMMKYFIVVPSKFTTIPRFAYSENTNQIQEEQDRVK